MDPEQPTTPNPPTPAERLAAEVTASLTDPDGTVTVTLKTDRGEADIKVPPMRLWRSSARAALFTRDDTYTWAQRTLAPLDFLTWDRLDPVDEDAKRFFTDWGFKTGQQLAEAAAFRNPIR